MRPPASPFSIARTRSGERIAWHGSALLVCGDRGDCDANRFNGFFVHEARHLSGLMFRINGVEPWLCSDGSSDARGLDLVFIFPELTRFGGGGSDLAVASITTDDRMRER